MTNETIQALLEAGSPLLVALVGLIGYRLNRFLLARIKNERLRGVLTHLSDASQAAVLEVEQTLASGLREAAKDGKITEAEKRSCKDAALEALKRSLGESGRKEASEVLGLDEKALDKLLEGRLEAVLAAIKKGGAR